MINIHQILSDLEAYMLADSGITSILKRPDCIYIEGMEREIGNFNNMPCINLRIEDGDAQLVRIPNGYHTEIEIKIDVICFDLSHFKKAAKLRDDIMNAVFRRVRTFSAQQSSDINASKISGKLSFLSGTPDQGGGHIALGTMTLVVSNDVDS